jgi:hypothetical protein
VASAMLETVAMDLLLFRRAKAAAVGSGSAELLDETICHCLILVSRVGESSVTDDLYTSAAAMGDWPSAFVDEITEGLLEALERLALALAELCTIPMGSDLS